MLFDLDGVLADSLHVVERVWTEWALDHGFDPAEVVRKAHGRTSLTTIRELLPDADHEAENQIVEDREIADVAGVTALPGARTILSQLPPERWAIVTSGTRPLAETRIRAAQLPFPRFLVTGSDIQHGKPHPEPYRKGAALLGLPPGACVVVEDAPPGVRSGKGAGARVIALRSTASDTDLLLAGADWIVDDCASISASLSPGGELGLSLLSDSSVSFSQP
jgi:mannitol-1-/sugar-/sorbitol-6-phosphatase